MDKIFLIYEYREEFSPNRVPLAYAHTLEDALRLLSKLATDGEILMCDVDKNKIVHKYETFEQRVYYTGERQ